MVLTPISSARTIWACFKKDIKSILTEPAGAIIGILTPVQVFLLMSLFALGGANAPTAVVMQDNGPYAQQFYQSMDKSYSFQLQKTSSDEANNLLLTGHIVAIVTIPSDFDQRIQQQQPVNVDVKINNLNTDFTDDIRRAIPLSITQFYAKAFPNVIPITPREHDVQPRDTDYVQYLTVSIIVIGMLVGGILQAGVTSAGEWEKETMKELLLSPTSQWAIVIGKILAALAVNLVSVVLVLLMLVLGLQVRPIHWGEVIGFATLSLIIFISAGMLLGTLFKQRKAVVALTLGISIPLFFMSGPFGPLALNTPVIQALAHAFPIYYSIVLQQHAFHGFDLNTYGVGFNALILCGFALLLVFLSAFALRRSTVAH